jgi:hypothetical protein
MGAGKKTFWCCGRAPVLILHAVVIPRMKLYTVIASCVWEGSVMGGRIKGLGSLSPGLVLQVGNSVM